VTIARQWIEDAWTYTAQCKLRRPKIHRDASGKWQRPGGGEWDWFYRLEPSERSWIAQRFMSDDGLGPDDVASMWGCTVDEAMSHWLELVRLARRQRRQATVFSEEYEAAAPSYDLDINALVGPAEVADLFGVRVNTVAQWRHRFLDFPEPARTISGISVWWRQDIEDWALDHGRLPAS
jgi:hypothetical protein